MRPKALAFFLAVVMAWMGFTAQEQAAELLSDSLAEQAQAQPSGTAPARPGGSLNEHHLDDLPFQLLADLIGLLRQGDGPVVAGLGIRPQAPPPNGWLAPDLDRLQRPPIARG